MLTITEQPWAVRGHATSRESGATVIVDIEVQAGSLDDAKRRWHRHCSSRNMDGIPTWGVPAASLTPGQRAKLTKVACEDTPPAAP